MEENMANEEEGGGMEHFLSTEQFIFSTVEIPMG